MPSRLRPFPARRFACLAAAACAVTCGAAPADGAEPAPTTPTVLKMDRYFSDRSEPDWQCIVQTAAAFMRDHPGVRVEPAVSLMFTEGGLGDADSGRLMAIAGRTAPDVMQLWFHQLHPYAERDYILPLDEFIGTDRNGDGTIDDDEALWPGWRDIPPNLRAIATVNGHAYGLPYGDHAIMIEYRQDLFREVGLDPTHPPQTWDEFVRAAQQLTRPEGIGPDGRPRRARYGLLLSSAGSRWLPWLWSAGGEAVRQGRRDPDTGQVHWFSQEATRCVTPHGKDLSAQPPIWRATFGDDAGERAVELIRRLRWERFIHDPATGEPIPVTDADLARGAVRHGERELRFDPARDVMTGCVRQEERIGHDRPIDLLGRGEIAMMIGPIGTYLEDMPISMDHLGFFPFPAGPDGRRVVWREPIWFGLSSQLAGEPNRQRRRLAWDLLRRVCDRQTQIIYARLCAEEGRAKLLPPALLRDAGLGVYADAMPPHFREAFDYFRLGRTEPYVGHWQAVQDVLIGTQLIEPVLTDETFDPVAGLRKSEHLANRWLFGGREPAVQQRYRRVAWTAFAVVLAGLVAVAAMLLRAVRRRASESLGAGAAAVGRGPRRGLIAAALLAPALLSLLVWQYYPLARGSLMAFQDYRLIGSSEWIGLDNFIDVLAPDTKFYDYLYNTVRFAAWTLGLTFLTPIALAILLSEIPVGRYFFRTIYFLPQVASGLVILFLWKVFYEGSQTGWLNQIIATAKALLGLGPHAPVDWLRHRDFAMVAVVLPTLWAGMGIGSLIYLAALKAVPEEFYEAAEIDGCGLRRKLWHVTLPALKPLILINFIGAFIGTFQGMSNILVMTGGGPQETTTVLGLAIWANAFVYLDFGLATAMAWVLGILLIGFTLWQLRILRRVEFRRAEAV